MGRGSDSIRLCSCAKLWPRRGRETHAVGMGGGARSGGVRREVHLSWQRFQFLFTFLLFGPTAWGANSKPATFATAEEIENIEIWTYDSLSHRSCRSSRGIRRTATLLGHTFHQHTWSFQECCTLWWRCCLAAAGFLAEKKEADDYHLYY